MAFTLGSTLTSESLSLMNISLTSLLISWEFSLVSMIFGLEFYPSEGKISFLSNLERPEIYVYLANCTLVSQVREFLKFSTFKEEVTVSLGLSYLTLKISPVKVSLVYLSLIK